MKDTSQMSLEELKKEDRTLRSALNDPEQILDRRRLLHEWERIAVELRKRDQKND